MRHVLAVLMLLLASVVPARASMVQLNWTITFDPAADGVFADGTMTGALQFWVPDSSHDGPLTCGDPFYPPDPIHAGDSFFPPDPIFPPNPCFGASATLLFSFGGEVVPPNPTQPHPVYAFAPGTLNPLLPNPPPIIPLGMFLPDVTSLSVSGPLFAFSDATEVGTYTVTATQVPEPATLLLLGGGAVGLATRRRRR